MTNARIEKALNDPDTVALLGEAICGFTSCELLVLRSRLTSERRKWAHAQRQVDSSKRVPLIGWKVAK